MNILIIGANGFIGSHLSHAILGQTEWCVFAIDINSHYLNELRDHPRFTFIEGDISINQEWIENHIKECDVVLPLVAIAQPKIYVERPIDVFTLDFEENLKIIRWVHKYNRRLIFLHNKFYSILACCLGPGITKLFHFIFLVPVKE